MSRRDTSPIRVPREIQLRRFWDIDVIIAFNPETRRLVIKKPSGQVEVRLRQRDVK